MKTSVVFLFMVSLLTLLSCNRQEDPKEELESLQDTYKDENESTKVFDSMTKLVEDEMNAQEDSISSGARIGTFTRSGNYCPCSDVTVDLSAKTVTIDFKSACAPCKDGRFREGKVMISYTGRYRDQGSVITTTPINYKVNEVLVEGKKVVTNTTQSGGQPTWTVKVSDSSGNGMAKLTDEDGAVIQWKSERTRIMTAGDSSRWVLGSEIESVVSDDVYEIYGTADGISKTGKAWEAVVSASNPLVYKIDCWFNQFSVDPKRTSSLTFSPVQGVLNFTPEDGSTTTINYGDGECDRAAVVNFLGTNYDVALRR